MNNLCGHCGHEFYAHDPDCDIRGCQCMRFRDGADSERDATEK